MKKFFAVLMAAVMIMAIAVTAFADDIVIRDGAEGNGPFDLSAYSEGTLRITAQFTQEAVDKGVDEGWGVGYLGENADEWPQIEGYEIHPDRTAVAGETFMADFDLAAAKAAGVGVVNLYNGCVLVSVSVITSGSAEPAGDTTPVVAVAIMAMVSCAAVTVLRKKEA